MLTSYRITIQQASRNIRLLLLLSFLMGLTIDGGIFGVIFNLYVLRMDFGPEFVGQVNSAAQFMFAIGSFGAGAMSGIAGRAGIRRGMVLGQWLILVGAILVPCSDLMPDGWKAVCVMSGMLFIYLGLAIYYTNSGPFLMLHAGPESRSSLVAVQAALAGVASLIGGLVGGFLPGIVHELTGVALSEPSPYRLPLTLVAVSAGAAVATVLATRDDPDGIAADGTLPADEPAGAPPATSAYGLIALLALIRFLQVGAVAVASTFFNVYMDAGLGASTTTIGLWSAAARVIAVPAALIGPSISRRIGFGKTSIWASIGATLSVLPMAFFPTPEAVGLGYVGLMTCTLIRYPAFFVYLMDKTPERLRAATNGAGEMAAGLSFAMVALVGGYIIAGPGYPLTFLLGAGMTLAGTVIFWFFLRAKGDITG
jgi:MFS family permease